MKIFAFLNFSSVLLLTACSPDPVTSFKKIAEVCKAETMILGLDKAPRYDTMNGYGRYTRSYRPNPTFEIDVRTTNSLTSPYSATFLISSVSYEASEMMEKDALALTPEVIMAKGEVFKFQDKYNYTANSNLEWKVESLERRFGDGKWENKLLNESLEFNAYLPDDLVPQGRPCLPGYSFNEKSR